MQGDYNGVNLVVGDLASRQLAADSNRGDRQSADPVLLQPGHHGISNGCLLSTWPKVIEGPL